MCAKNYVFRLKYIKCIIHWEIDYLLIDIFAILRKPKKERINKIILSFKINNLEISFRLKSIKH